MTAGLVAAALAIAACSESPPQSSAPRDTSAGTTAEDVTGGASAQQPTVTSDARTADESTPTSAPAADADEPTPTVPDMNGTQDADNEDADSREPDNRETANREPDSEISATADGDLSGLDANAYLRAGREWMDDVGAPGLVMAIARPDAEPATFVWGFSDARSQEAMSLDHFMRIGSITKAVTAGVMLRLVSEGLVDLDAPVAEYLGDEWAPGYEHAAMVTVRDLLGHTSGFVEYAFDPKFYEWVTPRLDVPIEPEEIIGFAAEYGPVSQPKTEYYYNTTGYLAVGLIIEAVTGDSAAVQFYEHILGPLGLSDVFLMPDDVPPGPFSKGYLGGMVSFAIGAIMKTELDERLTFNSHSLLDLNQRPSELARSAGWTGGGIEAKIVDTARMFKGLFDGSTLSEAEIAQMTTTGPNPGYGLGVSIGEIDGRQVLSHGGGVPGFRSYAGYLPELDTAIALSTNLLGADPDLVVLAQALVSQFIADAG